MTLTHDQKLIRLTITGDPDGTGTRDGVFEFSLGDDQTPLSVTEEMRTETRAYSGTLLTLFNDVTGAGLADNSTENKDIALDLGEAQFAPDISGVVMDDQTHPDGSPYQWGDSTTVELTQTSATGQHPALKICIFSYWLRNTRTSSLSNIFGEGGGGPIQLEYLEYRADSNSLYDPLQVVLESPSVTYSGGSTSVADVNLTAVEVADLSNSIDALANDGR